MQFVPRQAELSIFPINLEKKNHCWTGNITDEEEESDDEKNSVLVIADRAEQPLETTSDQSIVREFKFPLLEKLQRNGQLQELTIIEHRRSAYVHEVINQNHNGNELKEDCSTTPKCTEVDRKPDDHYERAIDSSNELKDKIILHHGPLSNNSGTPSSGLKATKRRTRNTLSPNDPAEALTEMSVRGLDLFRYATINAGMYQCMVCNKDGIDKTFKNKYSFQRHAFLYHEGKQRKVFPCPVCSKEFSRPDKMKNHLRMMHESYEAKMLLYRRPPQELTQLHVHPQQQHHNHQHAEHSIPIQQLNEEQRRRQQEHDVMKIRSVVNAINLRQLQHLQQQQYARELTIRQSLEEQNRHKPIIAKQVEAPVVPTKLLALNGVGSQ